METYRNEEGCERPVFPWQPLKSFLSDFLRASQKPSLPSIRTFGLPHLRADGESSHEKRAGFSAALLSFKEM